MSRCPIGTFALPFPYAPWGLFREGRRFADSVVPNWAQSAAQSARSSSPTAWIHGSGAVARHAEAKCAGGD
ncbi:hypothetical protein GCM10010515_24780 [Streptomyces fructofermentans]|uniref:Uncharacterized protein n=1 Tax=Streptomyces fructofermentans TaxID=152141 RepID=A0A918KAX3_9ACTN|nr:hypothetical protein GCM10010515_24780 [Streptomyces fructofermentans]